MGHRGATDSQLLPVRNNTGYSPTNSTCRIYPKSVKTEQEKIYHHHTPRFYLPLWADAYERILWLGYGKIRRSAFTVDRQWSSASQCCNGSWSIPTRLFER